MALTDFKKIEIPFAAGANLSATTLEAIRLNDLLFERLVSGLLASPFTPSGFDGEVRTPQPEAVLYARNIVLSTPIALKEGIPLIWFAQEYIHINAAIDGKGKGSSGVGDLGGSGGGGKTLIAGSNCAMPGTGALIFAGGDPGKDGKTLSKPEQNKWVPRLFQLFGICRGGASGGGPNGAKGGGLVFLCAPLIVITANIDVRGDTGGAESGGGGGGAIIFRGLDGQISAPAANLLYTGGPGTGGGGKGGDGFEFQSLVKI